MKKVLYLSFNASAVPSFLSYFKTPPSLLNPLLNPLEATTFRSAVKRSND